MPTHMRYVLAIGATMMIWALAGCSATVSPGSPTTGGIKRYPTSEPLTGPAPVGYWACVSDFDPAEFRMSNSRRAKILSLPRRVRGAGHRVPTRRTGWELARYERGS